MELTVSRSYSEHLVVTDLAILRVERRSEEELRQVSTILLLAGAVVGPPLAALVDWAGLPGGPTRLYLRPGSTPSLDSIRDVFTCWSSEAPAELASHPRWPGVEPFRPVTVYPRALIGSVALRRGLRGGLRLELRREAAREVRFDLPWWSHGAVRDHLRRAGYPLTESSAP
ncbi:MAG: hypothetical protein AB7O37_00895 [Vicinamibacteria bacterium]